MQLRPDVIVETVEMSESFMTYVTLLKTGN